jgi:Ca2+-binding EF-hand superfamily protein
MRLLSTALMAACALGLASHAGAHTFVISPAVPAAAAELSDVQGIVYLGDRPVLIRMHLRIDGKPFAAAWDDYLEKFFRYLDRDNDGLLNAAEAKLAPKAAIMTQLRQGGFIFGNNTNATLADFGKPADGKVSLAEFKAYYRTRGARTFQLAPAQTFGPQAGALTDALFKLLDTNKDGRLSRAEIEAAPIVLRQLDLDDDELITAQEVLGVSGQQQFFAQPATPPNIVVVDPAEKAGNLTAIMTRYDRNKDGKLTREELGLDQAAFDRLDANKDDAIDATELAAFVQGTPEFELTVHLGKRELGQPIVESTRRDPRIKTAGENIVLTLGNTEIDLSRGESQNNLAATRPFYLQQFKQALTAKKDKGGLEAKDLQNSQLRFFPFALMDRNSDGKVTEEEFNAYLDLQAEASGSFCALQAQDGGQGLFDILDTNRDGRLSVRELRTAWQRVSAWDKDGDGCVARAEMPRQVQLILSRGPAGVGRQAMMVKSVMLNGRQQPPAMPAKGPLWFRKMDRNGDGDVSPREFLGSPEDFKKIDTNGDGLIDAEEAERATQWFAKAEREKR